MSISDFDEAKGNKPFRIGLVATANEIDEASTTPPPVEHSSLTCNTCKDPLVYWGGAALCLRCEKDRGHQPCCNCCLMPLILVEGEMVCSGYCSDAPSIVKVSDHTHVKLADIQREMADNVTYLDTMTNMSADQVLGVCKEQRLTEVIVIGYNADHEMYVTVSKTTNEGALWMMELALKKFWRNILKT